MTQPDTLAKLAAEYRPTMTLEVLHSWAADVTRALTAQALPAAPEPIVLPVFHPVAKRKLVDLQQGGFHINGYSIQNDATGQKGFITDGGFVGWWFDERTTQAAQQAAQAPAGWVMVPVEPTQEMSAAYLEAAKHQTCGGDDRLVYLSYAGYLAMLSALPLPPQPQEDAA